MREITGPIIAITLVLLSVFVPVGFIPGITGAVLYRQFAVAVSAAVIISAINALTLSPVLCALLLHPGGHRGLMAYALRVMARIQSGYAGIVGSMVRFAALSLLAVAVAAGAAYLFGLIPTGFLPEENRLLLRRGRSAAWSVGQSHRRAREPGREDHPRREKRRGAYLDHRLQPAQQRGAVQRRVPCHTLGPFRTAHRSLAIGQRASSPRSRRTRKVIPGASILLYNAPPIIGLGSTGGFQYELESIGGEARPISRRPCGRSCSRPISSRSSRACSAPSPPTRPRSISISTATRRKS